MSQMMFFWDRCTIRIFFKKSFIFIFKAIFVCFPGIVGRVDIDNINLALVGIIETREGVVVVALNDDVRRFAVVVFDSLVLHLLQHGDLVFGFAFKPFWHVEPYKSVTLLFDLCMQPCNLLFEFADAELQFLVGLFHFALSFLCKNNIAQRTQKRCVTFFYLRVHRKPGKKTCTLLNR